MSQVTWRASEALVAQVKAVAAREGRSLNDYLTRLVTAAVDPDSADDEMQSLRERLARAGVLAAPEPPRPRPTRRWSPRPVVRSPRAACWCRTSSPTSADERVR